MRFDLHCHSTASDGALSPGELLQRAADSDLELLAITDHDTLDGWRQVGDTRGVRLVPGIELSSRWGGRGVHLVGLAIDPDSAAMAEALRHQRRARLERAGRIAEKLEKLGAENPLEGARAIAGGDNIGRPHFARHLVASGFCDSVEDAFRRHLGDGRPGDVKEAWPTLEVATRWIVDAGGIAVLAHPARYKLTATRLRALVDDFVVAGGRAIEVICGSQPPQWTRQLAALAAERGLLASAGSDFHRPGRPWAELGRVAPLPDDCEPVWRHW